MHAMITVTGSFIADFFILGRPTNAIGFTRR